MAFRLVLTAAVVIGGVIETSLTGARIVLDGPSDTLTIYDSTGTVTGRLGGATGKISAIDVPDHEFACLFNGSLYVGNGDPDDVSPNGITTAGQFTMDGAAFSAFLTSGRTAVKTSRASLELFPGDPAATTGTATSQHSELFGDLWARGNIIHEDSTGLATWHFPTPTGTGSAPYGTGWAGATVYQTLGGDTLAFRLMGEDDLWIYGLATTATAGSSATVLTLPPGFRPAAGFTPHSQVGHSSGGVQSLAEIAVTSAGAVIMAATRAAGDSYSFNCRIPLRNVP